MLKIGDKAPDLELKDQTGTTRKLFDIKGDLYCILYFYPKDDTPGCTAESCSFRDNFEDLKKHNACIVGVSSDSAESHEKFAKKYKLPFTLLSDPHGHARKLYDVKHAIGIVPARATFVIDRQGKIIHAFSSQTNVKKHVDDAIKVIKSQE